MSASLSSTIELAGLQHLFHVCVNGEAVQKNSAGLSHAVAQGELLILSAGASLESLLGQATHSEFHTPMERLDRTNQKKEFSAAAVHEIRRRIWPVSTSVPQSR
jgi:hypothetical protein